MIIKKIVLVVRKINKNRVLRGGAGLRETSRGGDVVRQNHVGWGRRPHLLALPRPIAIPRYDEKLELKKKKSWNSFEKKKFHG